MGQGVWVMYYSMAFQGRIAKALYALFSSTRDPEWIENMAMFFEPKSMLHNRD
jgi:hypothetical protein